MLRRTRDVLERSGGKITREFIQQVASAASLQDMAGQVPQLNASLGANNFLGQIIGNPEQGGRTMQQWLEFFRSPNPDRNDPLYRQIYDSQLQDLRAQTGKPPIGPATPEEDAAARRAVNELVQTAQQVLQQYRREYTAAWQQPGREGEPKAPTAPPIG
jgi:hypothetical protein